jgi:transcriptional regulator with XRE-family HTH domain
MEQDQPDLNRRVGRAVAAAMKARGANGRQICAVLNLSKAQVSARLNGHTPFRADQLILVGEYLGVDAGQFLSASPQFPLRRQWEVVEGAPSDQPELPFRPRLSAVA